MDDMEVMLADVVVVGGGGAGLAAAVEAAEGGARTVLLESEGATGGSTALSAGHTAFCDTTIVPGGREALYADLIAAHDGEGDHGLSRLYVDEAGATCEWLAERGIHFARSVQLAKMSRPWAHEMPLSGKGGGAQITEGLEQAARKAGAQILPGHRARRLHLEGDRVTMLDGNGPEGAFRIRAARGIVLASGGFTRNAEMIRNWGPKGADKIVPFTGAGSRGDGLTMALALGCGTAYMAPGISPTGPADPVTGKGVLMIYAGAVMINRDGQRFHRESDLYSDISKAGMSQPDTLMIQVYDQRAKDYFATTMWARALTGFVEHAAPDLPSLLNKLAEECGLDAAAAAETIADYNRSLPDGDRLGRRHLVGDSGQATPVDSAPYYAAITRPGTSHYNGGVQVTTRMEVKDVFGNVIPGLYAAGEIIGGFHGPNYMSATQVGKALIFGRVAGRSAAMGDDSNIDQVATSR
ncbi:FAD-dependent oxidoreductase [Paracoccus sp. pheM1]|nr:FAD-dependent oxidoreductase [Paracoccus sp. pheM1]